MRALAITGRGAAPAVLDVPRPDPGEGEVRVAVDLASVNGFDLTVAAGRVWDGMAHEFPVVLGRDFVGAVDAVGPGVDRVRVGDRVAGVVVAPRLGQGSLGEYVTTAESGLTALPSAAADVDAAAVGLAGVAALDVVDAVDPAPGDAVLVCGATGGVGALAVQLAVARGATVLATARPGGEEEFVRSLGAAHAVDYRGDLAAAVRALVPDGVAKAVHAAGDAAAAAACLRAGGRLSSLLGADPGQLGRDDVTVLPVVARTTPDKLATLLGELANGRLRVRVATIVPLERATEALEAFRAGTLGKVLVRVTR